MFFTEPWCEGGGVVPGCLQSAFAGYDDGYGWPRQC